MTKNPDTSDRVIDLRGPWFNSRQAMAYIPCASLDAFYHWRKRYGLIARGNGSVAKADIDRILRRRSHRGRHPNSLANLRKRALVAKVEDKQ